MDLNPLPTTVCNPQCCLGLKSDRSELTVHCWDEEQLSEEEKVWHQTQERYAFASVSKSRLESCVGLSDSFKRKLIGSSSTFLEVEGTRCPAAASRLPLLISCLCTITAFWSSVRSSTIESQWLADRDGPLYPGVIDRLRIPEQPQSATETTTSILLPLFKCDLHPINTSAPPKTVSTVSLCFLAVTEKQLPDRFDSSL